jgi:hypothetical protein
MPAPESKKNAPWWIKAFVVFHLVCITMWSLPYPKKPYMNGTASFGISTSSPSAFIKSFSETVTEGSLYLNWKYLKGSPLMYYPGATGFWQYWDMFSPNPADTDIYMEADVVFEDGKKIRYKFPRIYTMPIPAKYVKERHRKYFENVNQADQSYTRPFTAQRIALDCYTDPNNPPRSVALICFADTIEPPGTKPDPTYKMIPFYTYQVDVDKLKRDKGITP